MVPKTKENGLCTSILKVTQLAFSCSNSTIYDVNICSKSMLLCEECPINSCGQNFPKITEKKLNVRNRVLSLFKN